MPASPIWEMFGEFGLELLNGRRGEQHDLKDPVAFGNAQKILLAATAIAGYAVMRYVGTTLNLPAVPGVSSLLLQGQSILAWPVVTLMLVLFVLAARGLVGTVRPDAPLFCAALALLAVPTRGGDARNALLDNGGAGVYVRMAIEIVLLAVTVLAGYVAMYGRPASAPSPEASAEAPEPDTGADRLATVGSQALFTLALLAFLGQTPVKGQALLGTALAAGLAAFIAQRTRRVGGSIWYVAGTLLAGFVAYVWTYLHPAGVEIGDVGGLLAGAARSLPLHYATAGVAGTIYGYWVAIDLQAERDTE